MTKADEKALEQWHEDRRRRDVFMATELGKLYRAHEQALINYWRRDADVDVSTRRLLQLDQMERQATDAFVAKLMELAGV